MTEQGRKIKDLKTEKENQNTRNELGGTTEEESTKYCVAGCYHPKAESPGMLVDIQPQEDQNSTFYLNSKIHL